MSLECGLTANLVRIMEYTSSGGLLEKCDGREVTQRGSDIKMSVGQTPEKSPGQNPGQKPLDF